MTPKDHTSELREKLAAIEHERWADWQRWVHTVYENPTRPFEEAIQNWKRQIDTPYDELSDREKASDMEQVDRYWPLIEQYIHDELLRARISELEKLIEEYSNFLTTGPLRDYVLIPGLKDRTNQLEKELKGEV